MKNKYTYVKIEYCSFCHRPLVPDVEFKNNPTGMKEWNISGLCSDCQDEAFSNEVERIKNDKNKKRNIS